MACSCFSTSNADPRFLCKLNNNHLVTWKARRANASCYAKGVPITIYIQSNLLCLHLHTYCGQMDRL